MIRRVAAGFAVLFTLVVAIAIATVMLGLAYWWVPRVGAPAPAR